MSADNSVAKFFRVTLSSDVLFPRKTSVDLNVKTEFKMLEENLIDSSCLFEPACDEEASNVLLSVIPVRIYVNRSVQESHLAIEGLALKAEKMSDAASYVLDTITVDCLVPAEELISMDREEFASNFKKTCLDAVLGQLKDYVEKLTENPNVQLEPVHFATPAKVLSALVPSKANLEQRLAIFRDKFNLKNELIYGDILSEIWSCKTGNHLINPHVAVPAPEPVDVDAPVVAGKSATVEIATVQGFYRYYRYNEDGMADSGWGCAYRSLQSVCSWFRMQSFTEKPEPNHQTTQKTLVKIGDKGGDFIGSSRWIGSLEVGYVLENYLGIKSRILSVTSGDELDTLASELIQHFRTEGSPIMIGGGVFAYTIIGVFLNRATGIVRYLVLDPHYSATPKNSYADELKSVTSKGYVGWKDISFWKKGEFCNLCLPMRPKPGNKA